MKRGSTTVFASDAVVEYLGIQENPNRTGWAAAKNYGYDLVSMMKAYF